MPRQRKEIALQVAKSLYATEDSIDTALTQVAKFVAELPAARAEAQFAACVGQDALAQAIAALTALSQAREAMVKAHEALADVRDEFSLGPVGYGVDPNKPRREFARRAAPLQAVA